MPNTTPTKKLSGLPTPGWCARGSVGREIRNRAMAAKDTEVINFFAPPRDDFLLGGKPAMSEG
jgi:hypothetical protein